MTFVLLLELKNLLYTINIYLHKCTFFSSLALFLVVAHIVPGGEPHSDDVMFYQKPLTPPPSR